MKALDTLRRRLVRGARIQCVENTFLLDRAGEMYVVNKAHDDVAQISGINGTDRWGQITVPMRADLVTWIDTDTVRWPLTAGAKPRVRGDGTAHTVTYRFLPDVAVQVTRPKAPGR